MSITGPDLITKYSYLSKAKVRQGFAPSALLINSVLDSVLKKDLCVTIEIFWVHKKTGDLDYRRADTPFENLTLIFVTVDIFLLFLRRSITTTQVSVG